MISIWPLSANLKLVVLFSSVVLSAFVAVLKNSTFYVFLLSQKSDRPSSSFFRPDFGRGRDPDKKKVVKDRSSVGWMWRTRALISANFIWVFVALAFYLRFYFWSPFGPSRPNSDVGLMVADVWDATHLAGYFVWYTRFHSCASFPRMVGYWY